MGLKCCMNERRFSGEGREKFKLRTNSLLSLKIEWRRGEWRMKIYSNFRVWNWIQSRLTEFRFQFAPMCLFSSRYFLSEQHISSVTLPWACGVPPAPLICLELEIQVSNRISLEFHYYFCPLTQNNLIDCEPLRAFLFARRRLEMIPIICRFHNRYSSHCLRNARGKSFISRPPIFMQIYSNL